MSKLKQEQKKEKERQWVEGILMSAQNRSWHGTISVVIKRGEIVLVKKEETFLPPKED